MNSINGLPSPTPWSNRSATGSPVTERGDMLILPGHASNADEARQKMQEAREKLAQLGAEVGRELKASSALTVQLSPEQKSAMQEAGFQVLQDEKVAMVPHRPKPSLQPGWMLGRAALEATSEALSALGGDIPADLFPPASQKEETGYKIFGLMPGTVPMPMQVAETPSQAEGPSAFTGPLPTTGKGVGIAIIDSGIYPHPDLSSRLVAFVSATGDPGHPVDELGHGTHVAGDAAGSGATSGGRLHGPAPDASLIGIQVLDGTETEQRMSEAIEHVTAGLQWMVENKDRFNIRVANLSLGLPLGRMPSRNPLDGFGAEVLYDPIGSAINRAVASGITVVAAAGNSGSAPGTINESPGINENVITVGALDTRGTPDRSDDVVAEFSSRGPSPDGRIKPDILAPGVNIMAPCSPGSSIEAENTQKTQVKAALESASERQLMQLAVTLVQKGVAPPELLQLPPSRLREILLQGMQPHETAGQLGGGPAYMALDGTSMASPIVAGVVADMIEANPSLTPAQVKEILKKTADPLPGVPATDQGAGVMDAREAIEMAARMRANA